MLRSNVLLLPLLFALAGTAQAQEEAGKADPAASPSLALELNGAEPVDQGCRLTFLLRNGLGADLEALSLETVILTGDGQVERLTLFDFGTVPADRPRVRQFDLAGLSCGNLGQVLVNGATACEGEGLGESACIDALDLSSRVEAELIG